MKKRTYKDLSPEEKFQATLLLLKKRKREGDCSYTRFTAVTTHSFFLKIKKKIKFLDPIFSGMMKTDYTKNFFQHLIDLYYDDNKIDLDNIEDYFKDFDLKQTYLDVDIQQSVIINNIKKEKKYKSVRLVLLLLLANYFEHNPKWRKMIFED